ncbi:MAG: HAD family hydrolase [Burkholderiales bacterium]
MNLALFDLDNTLLAGDSDFEWAQFLIEQGVLDREVYEARNAWFFEQYQAGTLDIHAFLDFQLKPLSRHKRVELEVWHGEFMQKKILPMMTQKSRDLVSRHRQQGDVLAIVTATNSFVTGPIAKAFGVESLIATEPEVLGREFTGNVLGTPSFREGKITRLAQWLEQRGQKLLDFSTSYFYSDSHNDMPLLECVTNPVAVDPDERLKNIAIRRGWPVISLK